MLPAGLPHGPEIRLLWPLLVLLGPLLHICPTREKARNDFFDYIELFYDVRRRIVLLASNFQ